MSAQILSDGGCTAGALDEDPPQDLERQRSTPTGGQRALHEDPPQDLERQRSIPTGEQRALDEDPPQDLERQCSTPTGGGQKRFTRIPLRIWSAIASHQQGPAGATRVQCTWGAPTPNIYPYRASSSDGLFSQYKYEFELSLMY